MAGNRHGERGCRPAGHRQHRTGTPPRAFAIDLPLADLSGHLGAAPILLIAAAFLAAAAASVLRPQALASLLKLGAVAALVCGAVLLMPMLSSEMRRVSGLDALTEVANNLGRR